MLAHDKRGLFFLFIFFVKSLNCAQQKLLTEELQ